MSFTHFLFSKGLLLKEKNMVPMGSMFFPVIVASFKMCFPLCRKILYQSNIDLLVALLLLSFGSLVTVNVLWLFLTVLWVSLQFMIVVFTDHTHLLFDDTDANLLT